MGGKSGLMGSELSIVRLKVGIGSGPWLVVKLSERVTVTPCASVGRARAVRIVDSIMVFGSFIGFSAGLSARKGEL